MQVELMPFASGAKSLAIFTFGLMSGIGAGMLVAPQSGPKTRRKLLSLVGGFDGRRKRVARRVTASVVKAVERKKRIGL